MRARRRKRRQEGEVTALPPEGPTEMSIHVYTAWNSHFPPSATCMQASLHFKGLSH